MRDFLGRHVAALGVHFASIASCTGAIGPDDSGGNDAASLDAPLRDTATLDAVPDASGSDTPGSDTSQPPADTGSGTGAPAVWVARCQTCHGADGKGTMNGPEVQHSAQALIQYYVRNGDDNNWGGTGGCEARGNCATWGDQRTMTAFDTTMVSDADLVAIGDWLRAQPHDTDGAGLYGDFCSLCHGPGGDIPTLTYYVKNSTIIQNVGTYTLFHDTVRNGLTAQVPDRRDAFMPPLGPQLTDAEIHLIAEFMCTRTYSTRPGFCSGL